MSEEKTTKQKITSPSPFSSSFRFMRFADQPSDTPIPANHFELDECDVFWPAEVYSDVPSNGGESLRRPGFPEGKFGLSAALAEDGGAPRRGTAGVSRMFQQSAPVNVPAWPRGMRRQVGDLVEGEEEEAAEDEMLPPHLMVARSRSRAVAFSVFEGVGRTLKGRDLRRVRNAVFQKTGFLE